ncbi:MAG: hypothetical protein R3F14_09490 [Polyangiaceae bacterium]
MGPVDVLDVVFGPVVTLDVFELVVGPEGSVPLDEEPPAPPSPPLPFSTMTLPPQPMNATRPTQAAAAQARIQSCIRNLLPMKKADRRVEPAV